jgi:hypothetical protein
MISGHDRLVNMMSVHPCSAKPRQGSGVDIDCFGRIESSYKLQPPGAHDKISLIFSHEDSVTFGTIQSGPILKRNVKCIRSPSYSSVLMVGNDSNDLSVKDRWMGSGKFDQFLKARTSSLIIAARKN